MIRRFTWGLGLALLLFPSVSMAALNEEILDLSKRSQPQAYSYAMQQGAKIIPTKDGRSFVLVWLPPGFDAKKDPVFVSLHGHGGWAVKDFHVWHKHVAKKNLAFIGIQWWYGRSMESIGYAKPDDIYRWITESLEDLGVPRGRVIFEGFSMGSANSYAVTYLDRRQGTPYFGVTISNAGQLEDNFPPNKAFLDGRGGPKPFDGARWIIYCGEKDSQHGCGPMRETKEELEGLGAVIDKFIQDPNGDHGGFMKDDQCEPALDLAKSIVTAR